MTQEQIIQGVFTMYGERGHRLYGEDVTELQHALQCAMLARRAGEPARIVAACLLHDYGHLLHDLGEDIAECEVDARHETLGADRLAPYFGPEVVEPIRLHVAAKRYLCWRQPGYANGLSDASRRSLRLQGGAMTEGEAECFARTPHAQAAVRVRRYDDAGKMKHLTCPGLESYRELLTVLLRH
jgi:[1-hydroxy-2-(trimethylamino)ethyl]phosphonate dioxygenase